MSQTPSHSLSLTPELIALGERWLPDVSFERNSRDPVAPGLRLSNPCGACRILDYFEERGSRVTPGVNSVGHLYADWFINALLKPSNEAWETENSLRGMSAVQIEPLFSWGDGAGESGLDSLILQNTPYRAHYEYKTSSQKNPKPTSGNRSQVVRQRVNLSRNILLRYEDLPPSVIYIIGKTGHFSSYVYGPFHIQPTPEEYAAAERDMDLTAMVFRDCKEGAEPREHPLIRQLQKQGCYDCFPIEVQVADASLSRIMDEDYYSMIDEYLEAVSWHEGIQKDLKGLVGKGEKKETERYIVHHQRNGSLKIRAK